MILHEIFRVVLYHVSPTTFHVISRKVDILWPLGQGGGTVL